MTSDIGEYYESTTSDSLNIMSIVTFCTSFLLKKGEAGIPGNDISLFMHRLDFLF